MVAITDITGIGPVLAAACAKNGYGTVRKIATTSAGKLAAVPGISEVKARTVIEAAKLLLGTEVAAKDQPKAKKTNKGKKKSKKGKKGKKMAKKKKDKKKKDKNKKKGKNKKKKGKKKK